MKSSPRIQPLSNLSTEIHDPKLQELIEFVGYRPNALATMARQSGLLPVVLQLINVTLRQAARLPSTLRLLIACQSARRRGCMYTATHLAHSAHLDGVCVEKIAALDAYDKSDLFSAAERTALSIATLGEGSPSRLEATTCFQRASIYFSADELSEIVAAIATAGWFSDWNRLVQSELEEEPASILQQVPWLENLEKHFSQNGI